MNPPTALGARFAQMLGRRSGVWDPAVLLAAARACDGPARGDVGVDLSDTPDVIAALLAAPMLVRRPEEDRPTPLVLDGTALMLDRYFACREQVVQAIRSRIGRPATDLDEVALRSGLDRLFAVDSPSPEQRQAAETALRGRLTVIAGGPGTGKTAVVVKLLALLVQQARVLGRRPPRVVLVAPTGKAAARLSESIRGTVSAWIPEDLREGIPDGASTIHRALGTVWGTPRFKHDAANPLPADVVVVDEASMVDLPLMARLLAAVPPDARLVLLGDPDQLVSVELGAVLGDLVAAEGALAGSVVRLRHTFRYPATSGIGALAAAILAGDATRALEVLDDPSVPDVRRVDGGDLPELLRQQVVEGYQPAVATRDPATALAAARGFRVLCAHRQGRRGVDGLGAAIEGWLRDDGLIVVDEPWYLGRPVLVGRNDRQVGLFNGDLGVVLDGEGGRRVWFEGAPGELRSFAPVLVPASETVWATTVHKAQGSEYDDVVVVLPAEAGPLVTRELLYTAVTRARRSVTVVGSDEVVAAGVGHRVVRFTGLRGIANGINTGG